MSAGFTRKIRKKDFLPSPGKIAYLKEPAGPGIRNDCGIYSGFEVPVDYDPILSKLIVHAQTRGPGHRQNAQGPEKVILCWA